MKAYLAGPMRGIKDFNFPAFDRAAEQLRREGYDVFSPADHDRDVFRDLPFRSATGDHEDIPGFSIRAALGADLAYICGEAEIIFTLPGWRDSLGAQAEVATALALWLPVVSTGRGLL